MARYSQSDGQGKGRRIGFIALSEVPMLNGLVMVSFIHRLLEENYRLDEAIYVGVLTRLARC